jgi:regulatory protein
MERRITKSVTFHGGDPDEYARMLDELVEQLTDSGVLDDGRWARARADELHRRGTPTRGIRAKLRQKGVASETVDVALRSLQESLADEGDPDEIAAWEYARRRRLGPFSRTPERRAARRDKDLAAMGRCGFSWGLAREVIDGSLPNEHRR